MLNFFYGLLQNTPDSACLASSVPMSSVRKVGAQDSCIGYHAHDEFAYGGNVYNLAIEKTEGSPELVAEIDQMIRDFCNRTSVISLEPSQKELEQLWVRREAITRSMSNQKKAEVSNAVIITLTDLLSGDLVENDFHVQIRALCLVEFLYSKGAVERFIAEVVTGESSELLDYLIREVTSFQEHALRLSQLHRLSSSKKVPFHEGIVMRRDGTFYVTHAKQSKVDTPESMKAVQTSTGHIDFDHPTGEMQFPSAIRSLSQPRMPIASLAQPRLDQALSHPGPNDASIAVEIAPGRYQWI
jgi:hypothetical protein